MINQFLSLLTKNIKWPNYLLAIFLQDIYTFFFPNKAVSTMVNNTIDTYQFHTGVAKMLHQFLRMSGTKITLFHHFLLPLGIVKCDKILWELLRLKWFSNWSSANRTNRKSLLFNFDKALFTKCVTTIQIPWYLLNSIEEFITRWAIHIFIFLFKLVKNDKFKKCLKCLIYFWFNFFN